jgi:hypothetical protein
MKMPFMPDDTASGGVLAGTLGAIAPPEVEKINHSEGEEVKESES